MIKFFEYSIEIFNRIKIVLSPFLAAGVLGFLFYLYKPDMTGVIIGASLAFLGLILGIIIAAGISKKYGATEFNSMISSTPDFDKPNEKNRIE